MLAVTLRLVPLFALIACWKVENLFRNFHYVSYKLHSIKVYHALWLCWIKFSNFLTSGRVGKKRQRNLKVKSWRINLLCELIAKLTNTHIHTRTQSWLPVQQIAFQANLMRCNTADQASWMNSQSSDHNSKASAQRPNMNMKHKYIICIVFIIPLVVI